MVRIAARPDLDGPDRSPIDQHGPPVGQVELFDLAAEDRLADPPPQLRRIGTRGQFVWLPVDHQFDSHGPRFAHVFGNGKCRGGLIGYGASPRGRAPAVGAAGSGVTGAWSPVD
ncbi:hypothetical protein FAGKG844_140033 [Frankia sp. AgKG'84/4]